MNKYEVYSLKQIDGGVRIFALTPRELRVVQEDPPMIEVMGKGAWAEVFQGRITDCASEISDSRLAFLSAVI